MTGSAVALTATPVVVLVAGLLYAAVSDWRTREVPDALWLGLGAVGAAVGVVANLPFGTLALGMWLLVAALVLEHLVPWDVRLERIHESLPGYVEVAVYLGVVAALFLVGLRFGVGPTGLSFPVIAVVVTVVLARILFETGVLYGGADAKALMVAGLLVPLDVTAIVPLPGSATAILSVYPFSVSLLMNAAIFAIVIPLGLAVQNARRGEMEFPRGFTGYRIDVAELPHRFVWLRDPSFRRDLTEEERNVETTDEDRGLRERQMRELQARGVTRVWVTPQIPFVVLMAAGAIATVLVGNVLFDLFALA